MFPSFDGFTQILQCLVRPIFEQYSLAAPPNLAQAELRETAAELAIGSPSTSGSGIILALKCFLNYLKYFCLNRIIRSFYNDSILISSASSLVAAAVISGAVDSSVETFLQLTHLNVNTLAVDVALILESAGAAVSIKCAAIGNPKPTLSWQFTDWTNTNTMDLAG